MQLTKTIASLLLAIPAVLSSTLKDDVNSLLQSGRIADYNGYWGLTKFIRGTNFESVLPYSNQTRKALVDEVLKISKVWSNLYEKESRYKLDTIAEINKIADNYLNYKTDLDLQYAIALWFASTRDLHTGYSMPPPHSCTVSLLPYQFDIIDTANLWEPEFVVTSMRLFPGGGYYTPQQIEDLRKVTVGSKVVSMNGKKLWELFYEKGQPLGRGANDFGGIRRYVDILLSYSHQRYPFLTAEQDEPEFVFDTPGSGLITLKLPYISVSNKECIDVIADYKPDVTASIIDNTPSMEDIKNTLNFAKFETTDDVISAAMGKDVEFDKAAISGIQFQNTPVQNVKFGIYKGNGAKLGVIRLLSMMPDIPGGPLGEFPFIETVRHLLSYELAEVDAVVFDIRSNPGGYISIADLLVTFFKPIEKLAGVKMQVSDVNTAGMKSELMQRYFPGHAGPYMNALQNNKTMSDFIYHAFGYDEFQMNHYSGSVWGKPVGIFNNAACYSACDMFSAHFQDNQVGIVFGEDPQTGAGGANVLSHRDALLPIYASSTIPFVPFPHVPELFQKFSTAAKRYLPDASCGWRLMYRNGITSEEYSIEDDGIFTERIIRAKASDYSSDNSVNSQYDYIYRELIKDGQAKGILKRSLVLNEFPLDFNLNITITNKLNITGYSQAMNMVMLRVFDPVEGKIVNELSAQSDPVADKTPFNFELGPFTAGGRSMLIIAGFAKSNPEPVFVTYRRLNLFV